MFGQHISTLYRCIMKINITIAIVTWVCLVLLVQRVRQLAFRFKYRQSVDDLCFVRGQVLNGLAFEAGLDHHHVLVEQHFAVFIIKRLHLLRYNRQPMVSDSATTPWGFPKILGFLIRPWLFLEDLALFITLLKSIFLKTVRFYYFTEIHFLLVV